MADLLGLHSRIFSGFRSQWMIDNSGVARNNKAVDVKHLGLQAAPVAALRRRLAWTDLYRAVVQISW